MFNPGASIRVAAAAAAALFFVTASTSSPHAQGIPAVDRRITYIMPQWLRFLSGDVAHETALLRAKIGEGPRVKVGFTTYIHVTMAPVDPTDADAVRAALAGTFAQMDAAIAKAQSTVPPIPICLSFLTAIRDGKDALQIAAQAEDRRNMQWHQDHSLADGWTTYSRYARKQERIQEAYIREIGKALASRMAAYPDILVAASGDGEIELSYLQAPKKPGDPMGIADYSPFAVAEFRDWLRGRGLYAAGQPFAGEAYANAARYGSDASLAQLNADFALSGTAREITTWDLEYFDWSLSDPIEGDPHAIPLAAAFDPVPEHPGGFDPPRLHQRGDAWSDLWDLFRATMVWRHNREFAKWMNESGVPADRWFSDQIPGDYLFGGTPENPNGRFDTSASAVFTADVSPYGSLGITSFNVNFEKVNGTFARTLAGAAPAIAARRVRWGVFEWNPSVGPSANMAIYEQEMALVERYRPSVLAPFLWNTAAEDPAGDIQGYRIEGTNFETALRDLVTRLNNVPLTLSRASLDIGATATGAARTPAQTVRVSGQPGETPAWSITSAPAYLDVTPSPDGRTFSVALKAGSYAPGTSTGAIVVTPSEPGYAPATLTVTLRVTLPGATAAPGGVVDLPANDALVAGEVAVTGWAVDDIGLARVSVYRRPVPPEADLVFIGDATFVPNARPDVQGAFPGTPQNDQAGWGYMLLSNMLPNGGNGTFTLVIRAEDVEGHTAIIGERRIVGRNSQATVPFGTIDTPRQGETVSGRQYINFGWALTPGAFMIPPDGSTITVLIDNIAVGHPTYGFARADIDSLFPGYSNSGGAVGFYIIDTTALTNGVHTIAWIVRDNGNRIQGIGSRFFTVANP